MNKQKSIILMGLGIFLMMVIFFSYSFGAMGNAKMVCAVLWFACVGIMRMGASWWLELER